MQMVIKSRMIYQIRLRSVNIGKGFTFIWDSYVHKFEPFDMGEVA